MFWDYQCPRCGTQEERSVSVAERDSQVCECGGRLARVQAFRSQLLWVPLSMRSSHDETTYLPSDPAQRQQFLEDAYRQHGKWRSDLAPGHKPTGDRAAASNPVPARRWPAGQTPQERGKDNPRPEGPDLKRLRRAEPPRS